MGRGPPPLSAHPEPRNASSQTSAKRSWPASWLLVARTADHDLARLRLLHLLRRLEARFQRRPIVAPELRARDDCLPRAWIGRLHKAARLQAGWSTALWISARGRRSPGAPDFDPGTRPVEGFERSSRHLRSRLGSRTGGDPGHISAVHP